MEVKFVNPFIEGVLRILNTTASLQSVPEPPYVKSEDKFDGSIAGVLEISGELNGTAIIGFSEKSILGIVSAMFGEAMVELNDEIVDAVGEISNMVAGNVTTKLGDLGKQVKVKFSHVLTMDESGIISTQKPEEHPVLVFPFKTTQGKVLLEVNFID